MDANDREDIRISLGKIDSAPAAFDRSPNRYDTGNAGFGCATQHIVEVVREIGIIEMRVRFD